MDRTCENEVFEGSSKQYLYVNLRNEDRAPPIQLYVYPYKCMDRISVRSTAECTLIPFSAGKIDCMYVISDGSASAEAVGPENDQSALEVENRSSGLTGQFWGPRPPGSRASR